MVEYYFTNGFIINRNFARHKMVCKDDLSAVRACKQNKFKYVFKVNNRIATFEEVDLFLVWDYRLGLYPYRLRFITKELLISILQFEQGKYKDLDDNCAINYYRYKLKTEYKSNLWEVMFGLFDD